MSRLQFSPTQTTDEPLFGPPTHYHCVTCQIRQKMCWMPANSSHNDICNECERTSIQCLGLRHPTWLTSFNALTAAREMIERHLVSMMYSTGRNGGVSTLVFDALIPMYAPVLGDYTRNTDGNLVGICVHNPMRLSALNLELPNFTPMVSSSTATSGPTEFEQRKAVPVQVATTAMSVREMFDCLLEHGCEDLTLFLDRSSTSSSAVAGGGFGDIYRGRLYDGTNIAIKALRHYVLAKDTAPKALKRAMRELYFWSKTQHDNVQELLGVIMFQGCLGMVSPWMDNGTLEEYIRVKPDVDRYDLCIQMARGVSYLHDIGMVHGDLKAKLPILAGGTLRWMAPELMHLSSDEDENSTTSSAVTRTTQTDVYALGMLMLVSARSRYPILLNGIQEIITGKVPYAEYKTDSAVIVALTKKRLPRRPTQAICHDSMWSLLAACWNHDPEARPSASLVYDQMLFIYGLFQPDFSIPIETLWPMDGGVHTVAAGS